jgi:hypothetical protein
MTKNNPEAIARPAALLSIDTWAVLIALLAAALIRFGLIPRVPW